MNILNKIFNIFKPLQIEKNIPYLYEISKLFTREQQIFIIENNQDYFHIEKNNDSYFNPLFSEIFNDFFSRYKKISYESAHFSIEEIQIVETDPEWIIIGHTVNQDGALILTKAHTTLISYDDSFFVGVQDDNEKMDIFAYLIQDYLIALYCDLPSTEEIGLKIKEKFPYLLINH